MKLTKSKERHSISLCVQEEALLQQAYEKYDGCRRLNNFISALVSIGLDRCLNLSDQGESVKAKLEFDYLHVVAKERNTNRAEGRPAQEKTYSYENTFSLDEITAYRERIKELERRAADYVTPHYDTKIIQFPQINRFMGSA